MRSQQTVIMHITAFFSHIPPFSGREGHWHVGVRIKDLIPVNCFMGREGSEGRENGKEADRNE